MLVTEGRMFENIGTIAASVAWELFRLPASLRDTQLERIRKENPIFHGFVVEHLEVLKA